MRIINLILFAMVIFQAGCYTVYLDTRSDDPIIELERKYSVRLDSTWTKKHAEALLKTFESVSQEFSGQTSVWKISNEELENHIKIESQDALKSVTISRDAFPIAGSRGISALDKRLFHAVVQFVTEDGTNRSAIKQILQQRYGISIDVPSYNFLKKGRVEKTEVRLTDFENRHLMIFISILEKFPQALHKVPQLQYVVCRSDDNMKAAGKAWSNLHFIEFSESFMNSRSFDRISKTIAHEKSYFLWHHLFPEQLKQDWIELGGWYKNPESKSEWSTKKDRKEFVTDYAYEKSPNEDMAASLAYYLVFPDKLRACNPAKYDFIHERIMLTYGARYVAPDRM